MKPLLFLLSRTIWNGIRRMVSSPKRMITFVCFIGYYTWAFGRNILFNGSFSTAPAAGMSFHLEFPAVVMIDSGLFAIFLLLSFPLLGSITAYNRTIKAADVDVLFPTPVSPKIVMGFRLCRDYLATLLPAILLAAFTWRAARLDWIFTNLPHPSTAGFIVKTTTIAWLLLAMVWTVFGYATTLFVNRSDLASDRNAKLINRITLGVGLLTLLYIAVSLRAELSWENAIRIAQSPVLRGPFFMATMATGLAISPLTSPLVGVAYFVGLVGLMGLGFTIALSQVGWMYDQAAVKGFETVDSIRLRRSGDASAIQADMARRGKIKVGRKTWIHRMRVPSAFAMLWREAVLVLRNWKTGALLLAIIAVVYSLLPVFIFKGFGTHPGKKGTEILGSLYLGMQGMAIFMGAMSTAAMGFVELLKRVDLLKPLPVTSTRLVLMEILAKTAPTILINFGCSFIVLIAAPSLALYVLANAIYAPTLAFTLTSAILVVLLIFPDIEDPTQRGFRGLMQMLGLAIAILPGLAAFVGGMVLLKNPVLAAIPAALLNIAVITGASIAAGQLYAGYNPSE